jgi:ribosomal protein S6
VKRYEGLFILNVTGKEDGAKDVIDQVSGDITTAGGTIETVQKMDKKPFARVTDKEITSGFYVNIIFEAGPTTLATLHKKFALNKDVYRVMFSIAPETKVVAVA